MAGDFSICPVCKEEIARGAVLCKHCGTLLKVPKKSKRVPFWRSQYMLGVYSGVILMVLLIVAWNRLF